MHKFAVAAALPVLASAFLTDLPQFNKRSLDKRVEITWGPIFYLGPIQSEIVSMVTTIYPGEPPASQAGGLFCWPGVSSDTGDLIQSIVGMYLPSQSECGTGTDADTEWCISSEVYGTDSSGNANQFVGDLRTLDNTPATGLVFNYTLVDSSTGLWNQTVHDATSGKLMSTYSKTSGAMNIWNTAVECQECTPTISEQIYVNTTLVLSAADNTVPDTVYLESGATYEGMKTTDNGKTWFIEKITIPAMDNSTSSS